MTEYNKVEEIKKLIKSGFDLELISFELDIPVQQLKQYQQEISRPKKTKSAREIIEERNNQVDKKIKEIRERYQRIFSKGNKSSKPIQQKELTKQEKQILETSIQRIEEIMVEITGELEKKERRKKVYGILEELKQVLEYPLSIEQAEKLINILESRELQNINSKTNNQLEVAVNKVKREIIKKLAETIETKFYQTEDIEELKELEKRITFKMEKESPTIVSSIKSKIRNKISEMEQQQAVEKIKNDIPANMVEILEGLAKGTLELEKARTVIEEEAQKRVEERKPNRFRLTQEQQRNQIIIQIRKAIENNAEKYCIENPETTINILQELSGDNLTRTVQTVVNNFIARKEFMEAKSICNKFKGKCETKTISEEIERAEVSDIVSKILNQQFTLEEERLNFQVIEQGLQKGRIKPRLIYLGKGQDGGKQITLADIWGEPNIREKTVPR